MAYCAQDANTGSKKGCRFSLLLILFADHQKGYPLGCPSIQANAWRNGRGILQLR